MKEKTLSIVISSLIVMALVTGTALATDIDLDGTFTPTSTTSASVNDTTPAYGNIAPGGNTSIAFRLTNDGTVNVDSTINTSDVSAALTKVVQADLDAVDEFSVIWFNTGGDFWTDLADAPETLKNTLAPTGTHDFSVNILMNSVGISAAHGAQEMDVVVAYTAST